MDEKNKLQPSAYNSESVAVTNSLNELNINERQPCGTTVKRESKIHVAKQPPYRARSNNTARFDERVNSLFCTRLLALFEGGARDDSVKFFSIWNAAHLFLYKQHHNVLGDSVGKLEFCLRVYFATNPLRKLPPNKQEYKFTIDELRSYLENGSGTDLATSAELVQFFALPYVREPEKHPVFKRIIQV